MGGSEECDEVSSLLTDAEKHIKELQDTEDYYFKSDKDAKMKALAARATSCVDRALAQPGVPRPLHTKGVFLRGRAASLLPGQEHVAEQMLSKVLKLDPKLVEAWNALGEVYWNLQKYDQARSSFEQAIEFCGENSVSLRCLSMVLRAIDCEADARSENYKLALEKAKAAVAIDTNDAQNWETLGNAYIGDFIINAKHPDEIKRALVAYSKADAAYEKHGKRNPTLHLNWGSAAKYLEDYQLALRCYQKADEIGAANAAPEMRTILELVEKLASYSDRKGDYKMKHVKELTSDVKFKEVIEGDREGEKERTLRHVAAGEFVLSPLVAKVVAVIDRQEDVPVIVVCCDGNGEFFALSIYNAMRAKVADALVPRKSVLRILKPQYRRVSVIGRDGKELSYPCVRVGHPSDVAVLGSGTLATAASVAQLKTGAERVDAKSATESAADEAPAVASAASDGGYPAAATANHQAVTLEEHTLAPAQERWIDQEDARSRKLAAKAKNAALTKAKSKAKAGKKVPTPLGDRNAS
eukprot:TRINITY_DN1348_c0_g1_i2.p1 TRINITY_DN1348_c0_g1~~TRINITY_DN1348_c0_g1_i2.p1  ORF type:complete len:526 (+),score=96.19 TRINITY_DN1348_c0_g1_i2:39-1616(+)